MTVIYEAEYIYTSAKGNDTLNSGKSVNISTKGLNKWMKGILEIQRKSRYTKYFSSLQLGSSICRVGIAHHHGMSYGCFLSGSARPTLYRAARKARGAWVTGSSALSLYSAYY